MSTVASPSPILDAAGVAPDEALSILQTALAGADDGDVHRHRLAVKHNRLFDCF